MLLAEILGKAPNFERTLDVVQLPAGRLKLVTLDVANPAHRHPNRVRKLGLRDPESNPDHRKEPTEGLGRSRGRPQYPFFDEILEHRIVELQTPRQEPDTPASPLSIKRKSTKLNPRHSAPVAPTRRP